MSFKKRVFMKQILLVEDSVLFGRLTKTRIEEEFDIPVFWAKTLAETIKLLDMANNSFTMALLDLNLPDAPTGEVIDHVVGRGITSFVFTSNMSDDVRDKMWGKQVADYILKDDPNSLDYIIAAIKRLEKNEDTLAMIVDHSDEFRTKLADLLYIQKFRVATARDGEEALEILDQYPDLKLIVTDFDLPQMDGFHLCQKVRAKHSQENLAIIGLSSHENSSIGARFLKSGANDVMMKESFQVEEFYSRVNNCVETIDLIGQIREAAIRDFLTGLYNRRHFFDAGEVLLANSRRDGGNLICAMMDIDFFKKVNDTHGHDVGDLVIQQVSSTIQSKMLETDIVARFGGEEFCVLAADMEISQVEKLFDDIRDQIESTPILFDNGKDSINVTISIGVCTEMPGSLGEMTKLSDDLLYDAKEGGRNCVRMSE